MSTVVDITWSPYCSITPIYAAQSLNLLQPSQPGSKFHLWNYHARKKPSTSSSQPPKPPTMQQHNGGATQSNLSSSQQPNTTAMASTTSPAAIGTAAAAGTSHPDITIKRARWLSITVHLHLKPSSLEISGQSDNVIGSIHYGHLTKAVTALSTSHPDVRALMHDVTQKVFLLVGDAVRLVISLPKQILLANDRV
ncbi:uncharacterized protein F5891DRAFT_982851 [Suillus fuscotomentosus]|uniref:Uncharacterized protein n=1 Tax=Suillus fuscotomentosus TaxID=1912939 RepID=A0AAD4E2U0_9AGAM|nr:uncharacterized protein F5891DRAFT_982851 [Suillus fuscotomentosus]KAG1897258.1 hypothetical protein F5891DRAFT_982851 [Suillus fuscotomentosus]